MASPTEKFRDLDPTVIPAQPGYRVAYISLDSGGSITEQTDPNSLDIFYHPIIAWVVRPTLKVGSDYTDISHVEASPVTPEGLPTSQLWYLVTPDNYWSVQNLESVGGEWEARRHFIVSEVNSQGQT